MVVPCEYAVTLVLIISHPPRIYRYFLCAGGGIAFFQQKACLFYFIYLQGTERDESGSKKKMI
jgi:hypothetical protein